MYVRAFVKTDKSIFYSSSTSELASASPGLRIVHQDITFFYRAIFSECIKTTDLTLFFLPSFQQSTVLLSLLSHLPSCCYYTHVFIQCYGTSPMLILSVFREHLRYVISK